VSVDELRSIFGSLAVDVKGELLLMKEKLGEVRSVLLGFGFSFQVFILNRLSKFTFHSLPILHLK
jgi:hypothetical protein